MMRVPLRWLEAYVPISLTPKELAERLTMSGSLVEHLINSGSDLAEIVVARVVDLQRHPQADKLWLARLDLGDRQQTVVTGAPNLFVDALVPYIGIGACLPGNDKPLEGKVLRGIRSEGMVCSGKELGINDDHGGILILDRTVLGDRFELPSLVGRSLGDLLGEWVVELDITPNRPDCLSMVGVAREVAAITGARLQEPPVDVAEGSVAAIDQASVRIEAPDLCSGLVARVISGIRVGPSPAWMIERLQATGVRSINNVVDITNYVMLELGQPLHAYDLDRLAGHTIVARHARPGESLTTLDGTTRTLSPEMLVIADKGSAVGVAGVMGGADTEVSDQTTRIVLEAGTFNPVAIRRASLALGLRSEASSRFEKGLPRQLASLAADRAALLMTELAGGEVARGTLSTGGPYPSPRRIEFTLSEVERLLGVRWSREQIIGNLTALGFICERLAEDTIVVTVPWWRNDVEEPADLVEEVARVSGFEAIPETLLRGSVAPRALSPGGRWYPVARHLLLSSGLNEGSSPALMAWHDLELLRPSEGREDWLSEASANPEAVRAAGATFSPVRVVNPLSPDREFLRISLLPELLAALRDNLRAGEERVTFFELDNCQFARPGDQPFERRTLALAAAGDRLPRSWAATIQAFDFFDLKGVVEQLVAGLGVMARIVGARHPLLHPGRSALLEIGGSAVGFLGELHPAIAERWDLGTHRAYVAEIDFDALASHATEARTFVDFPRLPYAKRDLAVVVDQGLPGEVVLQAIRDAAGTLLARVRLFDVYEGNQLPAGKKSLAYALDFQATDRTLTEEEIERVMGRIYKALAHRVGATLRA